LFIGCIMFCNFMFVFHVDLHAKLVFNIRFVFLPMFKLEWKIICQRKSTANKYEVLIATNCKDVFSDNQSSQKYNSSMLFCIDVTDDFTAVSDINTANLIGWFMLLTLHQLQKILHWTRWYI
jgi:hypothetical protein